MQASPPRPLSLPAPLVEAKMCTKCGETKPLSGYYEALLEAQHGVCAICSQDEPNEHGRTGTKFRLCVDHDHVTARVRGLLCQKCNRAIGLLGDNVDLLRKAIDYLERK